ncbi:oxidoreductase [Streptomyces sp. ICBB 8177]|nr:oxidoreductase [Streptomyces sp. ICBB 8177]
MAASAPVVYRVVRARDEGRDIASLVLEPVDGAVSGFAPGQFAMLYAFSVGDAPISVSEIDGDRLTHTVRAVGAVSTALRNTRPGEFVGVRGPFGTAWDLERATGGDLLMMAGGIGLAPLRPVVRAALERRGAFGTLNVLIGARTPDDVLYAEETVRWQEAGARVFVTVDRPAPSWQGDVGVVTALLPRARFEPARTTAFVCGPEVMIRATARELVDRGVSAERVQVSLERTMHCATGHCGHCQLGPLLLCRDGPVVDWPTAAPLMALREL